MGKKPFNLLISADLFSDDVDSVDADAEEDGATEEQNEVLKFLAPTFQGLGSKVGVGEADDADYGNDVGNGPDDAEGQDANGGKGQRQKGHLKWRRRVN